MTEHVVEIEHVTLAVMGPIPHTATQSMTCHCVIFQIGERVILLDTGFGTREVSDPNLLIGFDALFKLGLMMDLRLTAIERLKARGISPDQVTDIVLTHMDNDHAGGVHDFPGATVHVSSEELENFDSIQPRGPYKPYQISHRTKFKAYEAAGERWFGLDARSLDLPGELDMKLIPLPGHTFGHCGVAYREDGIWSLHAGDAYFDSHVNFLDPAPGLPIELAFQSSAVDRHATLRKLRTLRAEHGSEVKMYCTHDEHEFIAWTRGKGRPDPVADEFLSR